MEQTTAYLISLAVFWEAHLRTRNLIVDGNHPIRAPTLHRRRLAVISFQLLAPVCLSNWCARVRGDYSKPLFAGASCLHRLLGVRRGHRS